MNWLGFGGSPVEIDLRLTNADQLRQVLAKNEQGALVPTTLITQGDNIIGTVAIRPKPGKKVEHMGIKVEFIGQIEFVHDSGNPYEFLSLVRDLEDPGELTTDRSYSFEFNNVEKRFETYTGNNVRLRYFLRVRITRQYASNITRVLDLAVQKLSPEPEVNNSIKMEVGIEDCLHIEFEYNKSKYHLSDVVIGKIYFLLVRIKIKHMEIVIIKRESCGSGGGAHTYNESENISKYEIMDGAPVRGESIPVRLFLSPYDLTPTYKNIDNKFSVKYYLNLVLVDEEDRRYFKQQEIQLWRKQYRTIRQGEWEEHKAKQQAAAGQH